MFEFLILLGLMVMGERPVDVDELVNMTSKLGVDHEEEWEENEDAAVAFGAKSLVGKLISHRNIRENLFTTIFNRMWRGITDWTVKMNEDDGEEKLVRVTFKNVEDAKSVLGKQPWLFNGGLLILEKWPLSGQKYWIQFKFEHLPMLCFNCGIWGHEQKDCTSDLLRETDCAGNMVPKYGAWLKDDDPCPNGFVSAGVMNSTTHIEVGGHEGLERSPGSASGVHGGQPSHGGLSSVTEEEQTVMRSVGEGGTKIVEGAVNIQMVSGETNSHVASKEVKDNAGGSNVKQSIGPETCIGLSVRSTNVMDYNVISESTYAKSPEVENTENDKKKRKNGGANVTIDLEEVDRLRSKGKQVQQAPVGVEDNENFAIGVSIGEFRGSASSPGQRKKVSIKARARLAKNNGGSRERTVPVPERSQDHGGGLGGASLEADSLKEGSNGGSGIGEEKVQSFVSEVVGGRVRSAGAMEEFREVIDDCKLIDFSSSKTDLTWCNEHEVNPIMERLDRGLCNDEWLRCFVGADIKVLDWWASDHRPLVVEMPLGNGNQTEEHDRKKGRFHFEEAWCEEEQCKDIIEEQWREDVAVGSGVDFKLKTERVGFALANGRWDEEFIRNVFNETDADLILAIPFSDWEVDDKILWHYNIY
ncbi:hypothetical protein F8388_012074 [Cannabis sativa]|uniref:CCHC-type domain-containing protein n=1 Tax=Cannabis sativa TaxID=3483 RepID=A0A7J6GEA5_CANSA|nr:hypothetical protein G4B88_000127 [Cannabis sativa]KAF4381152.1 hypothetical protein F8388_012074 [Cannabis sativa]